MPKIIDDVTVSLQWHRYSMRNMDWALGICPNHAGTVGMNLNLIIMPHAFLKLI
jgi:hypothetical protein